MKLTFNILLLSIFVTITSCDTDSSFFGEEIISINEQLESKISENSEMIFYDDTLLAKTEILEIYKIPNSENKKLVENIRECPKTQGLKPV